jgi:dihydrolipoamide dehydrogenase
MKHYDIAVIGGGPAGYVAAIRGAQLGGRVCLIERSALGGTCLNRGCIPTKAYLKNCEIIAHIRKARERGILLADSAFAVDMAGSIAMKNGVIRQLEGGIRALLKSGRVDIVSGSAAVTADRSVLVDGRTAVDAGKIIIASGSKPARLPVPGSDLPGVVTSDEILDVREVPPRLAIIGGGVIGIEMARIFRAFGSAVTVIEIEERLLPFADAEISAGVAADLTAQGVKILTATRVEAIESVGGALSVVAATGRVEADTVLSAAGRRPETALLAELDIGMERGFVKVNDRMESSIAGIYAPGDVNGRCMLAHAAMKMGEVAAENAMGRNRRITLKNVPNVVYGQPEAAWAGLDEEQARRRHEITVGRFPFAGNGRALASGETAGFVKIVTEARYKEILGVHIFGSNASELINEAAALMEMEITAEELADVIHAHPTNAETLMEAAASSLGRCIHLP